MERAKQEMQKIREEADALKAQTVNNGTVTANVKVQSSTEKIIAQQPLAATEEAWAVKDPAEEEETQDEEDEEGDDAGDFEERYEEEEKDDNQSIFIYFVSLSQT